MQYHKEQERLDYRAALICSIFAEANRDRKKKHEPFTPADFMPKFIEVKNQSDKDMKEKAKLITQVLGGKII